MESATSVAWLRSFVRCDEFCGVTELYGLISEIPIGEEKEKTEAVRHEQPLKQEVMFNLVELFK